MYAQHAPAVDVSSIRQAAEQGHVGPRCALPRCRACFTVWLCKAACAAVCVGSWVHSRTHTGTLLPGVVCAGATWVPVRWGHMGPCWWHQLGATMPTLTSVLWQLQGRACLQRYGTVLHAQMRSCAAAEGAAEGAGCTRIRHLRPAMCCSTRQQATTGRQGRVVLTKAGVMLSTVRKIAALPSCYGHPCRD